jgi:hypothetical protein
MPCPAFLSFSEGPPDRCAGRLWRERDIGRVLSGMETVDGRNWLQLILSGVERKLQHDNEDKDDIDEIVTAIRNQSERPGSQIRRFMYASNAE